MFVRERHRSEPIAVNRIDWIHLFSPKSNRTLFGLSVRLAWRCVCVPRSATGRTVRVQCLLGNSYKGRKRYSSQRDSRRSRIRIVSWPFVLIAIIEPSFPPIVGSVRTVGVDDWSERVEAAIREEPDGYSYMSLGTSLYRLTSRQSTVTFHALTDLLAMNNLKIFNRSTSFIRSTLAEVYQNSKVGRCAVY